MYYIYPINEKKKFLRVFLPAMICTKVCIYTKIMVSWIAGQLQDATPYLSGHDQPWGALAIEGEQDAVSLGDA